MKYFITLCALGIVACTAKVIPNGPESATGLDSMREVNSTTGASVENKSILDKESNSAIKVMIELHSLSEEGSSSTTETPVEKISTAGDKKKGTNEGLYDYIDDSRALQNDGVAIAESPTISNVEEEGVRDHSQESNTRLVSPSRKKTTSAVWPSGVPLEQIKLSEEQITTIHEFIKHKRISQAGKSALDNKKNYFTHELWLMNEQNRKSVRNEADNVSTDSNSTESSFSTPEMLLERLRKTFWISDYPVDVQRMTNQMIQSGIIPHVEDIDNMRKKRCPRKLIETIENLVNKQLSCYQEASIIADFIKRRKDQVLSHIHGWSRDWEVFSTKVSNGESIRATKILKTGNRLLQDVKKVEKLLRMFHKDLYDFPGQCVHDFRTGVPEAERIQLDEKVKSCLGTGN